ncbi:hypothetical protein CRYUN_Cryun18bG0012600 [Craigia yunnanensis]
MALAKIAQMSAIFLLSLALIGCEGQVPFNAADAIAKAKDAAIGKVGPDVKTFNVLEYGAKADGKTDSSINFIRTFKAACNFDGNAMMVIPEGNFLIGPVIFAGPCLNPSLIIQANGMVNAQSLSYYKLGGGADAADWITFQGIKGLILSGHGTFNGQAAEAWKLNVCSGKPNCMRMPATMKLIRVNDAIIHGIKSVDPKGFHIMISWSQNLRILNVNLQASGESPNTDGVHMSKTSLVEISDSVIATGDDCVSIIQGCTNITVNRVTCGPGHGFSIGSLGHYDAEADVSGIIVKNCSMIDTDNGVRIKTYKNLSPSKASGIVFQDIIMTRVRNPIIIDQEYGRMGSSQSSKVSISDVQYINIQGTSASKVAVELVCSASNPCQGVQINNVNLQYAGPPNNLPFSSRCTNTKATYVGTQSPPPCP